MAVALCVPVRLHYGYNGSATPASSGLEGCMFADPYEPRMNPVP